MPGPESSGPESSGPGDARLPSLTGLRFAAALLVFGFHVAIAGLFAPGSAQHALNRAVGAGAVGVSFFFVLSGFVLTWSARPDDTVRRFWRRRLVKIYPTYVLAWAISLAGLIATSRPAGVRTAVLNLFLLQSWSPSPGTYFGVNSVSWSLSCEAFFYLLFPWLLPALARIRPERRWNAAAVLAAGVLSAPAVAQLLPAQRRYWFVYVFPPVRLLEFALGMVMALVVKAGRWPRIGVRPVAALLVLAYAVTPYLPNDAEPVAVTVIPFALLIAAVANADRAGRPGMWGGRLAVRLGEISFAFYLIHQSVIVDLLHGLGAWSSSPGRAAVIALGALALSVGLAAATHRFVEQPLMRRFGRTGASREARRERTVGAV